MNTPHSTPRLPLLPTISVLLAQALTALGGFAQERIRVDVETSRQAPVAPPVPESWTPHTLHHGVESTGVELDSPLPPALAPAPFATPDGDVSGNRAVPAHLDGDPYRIAFVGGEYVPAEGERIDPELVTAMQRGLTGTTYGFVMFEGRISSRKRAAVEALGVRLHDHHTFNAMTAEIPVEVIPALAASPDVRWVGYARSWQKTDPAVARALATSVVEPDAASVEHRFLIKVHTSDLTPNARRVLITSAASESEDQRAVELTDYAVIPEGPLQRALEADGARVLAYHDELRLFVVTATLPSVERFVARDFVHFVEFDGRIEAAHDRSTRQIGIDYIRSLPTSDGSDTVVGMMDSGMFTDHVDTQVKWYAGWGYDGQSVYIDSTGHGTHVMGTIMSPGIGNDRFRGCAPAVGTSNDRRIYVAGIFNGPSGNSASSNAIAAFSRFATPITLSGVTTPIPSVINHSWGVGTSGMPAGGWTGTDSLSLALDHRVFYDRQTHVVAAHNQGGAGYASQNLNNVTQPGVAKLALTVASCLSGPEADGSLPGRPHFSSNKGPTGDGRLCPQIMAPGRGIGSVDASTNNGYVSFNGTSMATPHIVGTIAGMHDHYSFMKDSPAITRAVVAATANPYAGTRSTSSASDSYIHRQGLGQIDAYKSHYQRDVAGGFLAGRYHGTFGSATNGFSFDLDIPADATRTNFVLTFDEEPASQGAVRSCIHDLDLYIDVAPFTAGFNTGEFVANRAWDTWDWYQNIASIPQIAGRTVRVKVYPRVAPSGSDVVRFGVAYMVARGDTTPAGTISVTADPTIVGQGDPVQLVARVTVPEFLQTNSHVDLSGLAGFVPSGLTFQDREDLVRTFSGGSTPDNFTLGLLGPWFSTRHRELEWTLTAPASNGLHFLTARLQADNRSGATTASAAICVDNQAPTQIQNLVSATHTPNVWSNQAVVQLAWDPANDNGCAGLEGLMTRWNFGGTASPNTINLPSHATSTSAVRGSSTQTQYFTISPMDRAGNSTLHRFAGPFLIDVDVPLLTTVAIDGGAAYTHDDVVDVALVASDAHSGLADMQHSWNGVTWSPWVAFQPVFSTSLVAFGGTPDEGNKTLRVRVRDLAGNSSTVRTDSIQYQRCPTLRQPIVTPSLPNVSDAAFVLTGSDLADVTRVRFGAHDITSTSALDFASGYFVPMSDNSIAVHAPQGLAPGSYTIVVENRVCRSSGVQVQLQCNQTATLRIADSVDASAGFTAFVALGGASPQSLVGLALSPSNLPSIAPGILSLGIGNMFQSLWILPLQGTVDASACLARFALPAAEGFTGQSLWFEAFLIDPTQPMPFPGTATGAELVEFF